MDNTFTLSSDDIAEAKRKFHEQLQREFYYRQAIRDGLIERCSSTTFTLSDRD